MAKATKSTVNQRVIEVAGLLLNGNSHEDIVHYCALKFKIARRQSDYYISEATEFISNTVRKNVEYDYCKAILRFEYLYKLSIEKKDIKTATTVNKELATLQGLYKHNLEHSGEIIFINNLPQ